MKKSWTEHSSLVRSWTTMDTWWMTLKELPRCELIDCCNWSIVILTSVSPDSNKWPAIDHFVRLFVLFLVQKCCSTDDCILCDCITTRTVRVHAQQSIIICAVDCVTVLLESDFPLDENQTRFVHSSHLVCSFISLLVTESKRWKSWRNKTVGVLLAETIRNPYLTDSKTE